MPYPNSRALAALAVLVVLLAPKSLAFGGGPLADVQKHFKPVCGGGKVKLPAWPLLKGDDGKRLDEIRKKTGSQRTIAFAEWAFPKAKGCKPLVQFIQVEAKLVGDAKREVLLSFLFEEEEDMDALDDCEMSAREMIVIMRGVALGFEDQVAGAGRGPDCKAAGANAAAESAAPKALAKEEGKGGEDGKKGGLTPQEIMAVIRANLNQIRKCYEDLLERKKNAAGKILVNFVIAKGTGKVKSVAVNEGTTINDDKMRGCVKEKIAKWRFPKPRGDEDVTVNYPFVFNPL